MNCIDRARLAELYAVDPPDNDQVGEIVAILADPDVAKSLTGSGLEPVGDTPQQFAAYLRSEAKKWQALVKKMCITSEVN